jgi:hypothetical protein
MSASRVQHRLPSHWSPTRSSRDPNSRSYQNLEATGGAIDGAPDDDHLTDVAYQGWLDLELEFDRCAGTRAW